MNAAVVKEAHNPLTVGVVAAVTGTLLGFMLNAFWMNHAPEISAQARTIEAAQIELRQHDQDIAELKVANKAHENDSARFALAIGSIEQTNTSVLGAITKLTDAADEFKRHFEGLQKSVDNLNDFIRPASSSGRH